MVSDIVEFSYKVYCILEKRKKRKKKREYVHSKALFLGGGEFKITTNFTHIFITIQHG